MQLKIAACIIFSMPLSVDDLYNRLVKEALEKHCSPSLDEHTQLLRMASIKKNLLYKALSHQQKTLSAEMKDLAASGQGLSILERFSQSCNFLGHLSGPEHNFLSMNTDNLRDYVKLGNGLRERFAALHASEPERFEEFLREHVNESAAALADKKPAAASWMSRLVRDEAGKVHTGKVGALVAGGAAVGGAVALLHQRHEAKAQEPSSGRG